MYMIFKIIVALDNKHGIGKNNTIPWKCSKDLKYFFNLTTGNGNNAIIMGKNTYDSIGKILPMRENIVLSSTLNEKKKNLLIFKNLDNLIEHLKIESYDEVWVIGGATIYKQFLDIDNIKKEIFVTYIDNDYNCDVFFPNILSNYNLKTNNRFEFKDKNISKNITGYFKIYT